MRADVFGFLAGRVAHHDLSHPAAEGGVSRAPVPLHTQTNLSERAVSELQLRTPAPRGHDGGAERRDLESTLFIR